MKNRTVEFFNLSFLDLLSGALASVIFLFIIVPKGEPIALNDPVVVTYDTLQKKFYGIMPDSLWNMQEGDTLFTIVGKLEANPEDVRSLARMEVPARPLPKRAVQKPSKEADPSKEEKVESPQEQDSPKATVAASKITGSKPDVPCVLSFEIKWDNKKDNVDLFVGKDNDLVFGHGSNRNRSSIGQWDSGKSRTSLFGTDLRTNQEAVRQFDELIPGTYDIFAQFKESTESKSEIPVRLVIYTKNEDGTERAKEHYFDLTLNAIPNQRTLIAKVIVGADGDIDIQTFK